MNTTDLARRAEEMYQARWQAELERTNPGAFVAIEPEAEEYFLGRTLSEASAAANAAHPGRRTFILRVGHAVTIHIGAGKA